MKKLLSSLVVIMLFSCISVDAKCLCSYRTQKKMLHNRKMIKNKVINAQVKGKMLAIQQLASKDTCNDPKIKEQILVYQCQIIDLTNQKICLKKEYKQSLRELRSSR